MRGEPCRVCALQVGQRLCSSRAGEREREASRRECELACAMCDVRPAPTGLLTVVQLPVLRSGVWRVRVRVCRGAPVASLRGLCPSLFLLSLLVLPGGAADASPALRSLPLSHRPCDNYRDIQLEVTQSLSPVRCCRSGRGSARKPNSTNGSHRCTPSGQGRSSAPFVPRRHAETAQRGGVERGTERDREKGRVAAWRRGRW